MPDDSFTTRRRAAPWHVLLPCTLLVALLHWWLLGGPSGGQGLPDTTSGKAALQQVKTAKSAYRSVALLPQSLPVGTRTAALNSPSIGALQVHSGGSPTQARPVGSAPAAASRAALTAVAIGLDAAAPRVVVGAASPVPEAGPDELADADHSRLALAAPRPAGRAGGSAASQPGSVPAAPPAPLPTTPPPSAELVYDVRRGALSGEGKLVWRMVAGTYTLSLEARLPVIGIIFSENSAGGFDAWGLAPLRYTERRMRRSERALTMTRDGPGAGTLSFSASTARLALLPGTQDRVSWLVQLAALFAAAAPGGSPEASASTGVMVSGATLPVASVNGDLGQWQFKPGTRDGALLHLERRSPNPYDTVAEVWLDPARRYWPARIRLSDAGGDALELELKQWRE